MHKHNLTGPWVGKNAIIQHSYRFRKAHVATADRRPRKSIPAITLNNCHITLLLEQGISRVGNSPKIACVQHSRRMSVVVLLEKETNCAGSNKVMLHRKRRDSDRAN